MQININGEDVFSIPTDKFGIASTDSAYVLQSSVDGVTFTNVSDDEVQGENNYVGLVVPGTIFKLSGNTDTNVMIKY
jgi:hypothetical protein